MSDIKIINKCINDYIILENDRVELFNNSFINLVTYITVDAIYDEKITNDKIDVFINETMNHVKKLLKNNIIFFDRIKIKVDQQKLEEVIKETTSDNDLINISGVKNEEVTDNIKSNNKKSNNKKKCCGLKTTGDKCSYNAIDGNSFCGKHKNK